MQNIASLALRGFLVSSPSNLSVVVIYPYEVN
jgi:hypothetical protein